MKFLPHHKPGSPLSSTRFDLLHRGGIGLLLSSAIAVAGFRFRSLSCSGAIGAVTTGTLTTAFGGYPSAALLVAFFLSSSALSQLPVRAERKPSSVLTQARTERRDAVQVLANGGVSTALAMWCSAVGPGLPYVGAIAAVTGDTWATEIGSRAPEPPRHVLTWKPVPAGTSGGVSPHGSIASISGGVFIGALAALRAPSRSNNPVTRASYLVTGMAAGAAGSLIDSLLGATLQERRWCPACQLPTEQKVHRCGSATRVVGGIRGLNNDVVNVVCSLTGGLVGYVVRRSQE